MDALSSPLAVFARIAALNSEAAQSLIRRSDLPARNDRARFERVSSVKAATSTLVSR